MTDIVISNLWQLAIFGFASGSGGALATILVTRLFTYFEKRAHKAKDAAVKKLNNRRKGDTKE